MKKTICILLILLFSVTSVFAQKKYAFAISLLPKLSENDQTITVPHETSCPLWTDTIVLQPEGYVMDADGDVEISSPEGLVWLISAVNGLNGCEPDDFEGRTVRLVNDIDFGKELWKKYCFSPVGTRETPFAGTFDGNGHRIHHLWQWYSLYDSISDYYFDMGLFGYIRHAVVKNVTLDSTSVVSSSCNYPDYYRGGMVGFADSLSLVENIHIHTNGIGFAYGSSVVGMNRNSTVRNCAFRGPLYYGAPIEEGAGLVSYNRSEGGYADAVVENCYYYGRINAIYGIQYNLAGLVCLNETIPNGKGKNAIVRNCHSTPTSHFIARHYGSLVAVLSDGSCVRNCYTDLTQMYQYAQIIGLNEGGEMLDCSEYTNINGVGTLAVPVTINDTTTDNLLDALNLWIANQEHPELYRTWAIVNDSIPVFADYYVGIPENEASAERVNVHPNPTSGLVSIEGVAATEVQVYNAMGQLLKTVRSTNEINLEGLPQGVYTLRIADEKGFVVVRKVVKE